VNLVFWVFYFILTRACEKISFLKPHFRDLNMSTSQGAIHIFMPKTYGDIFLLCTFLAEEGDIIVFSHRAVSAEECLLPSSSATTASWAKEQNSLSTLPVAKDKVHTTIEFHFFFIIIGQELTRPQIIIY